MKKTSILWWICERPPGPRSGRLLSRDHPTHSTSNKGKHQVSFWIQRYLNKERLGNRRRNWRVWRFEGRTRKEKCSTFHVAPAIKYSMPHVIWPTTEKHTARKTCCPNCQDTFTKKASMLQHIKRIHQSLIMKSGKIRRFTDNELVDYQFESIERSEHGAQRKPEKQQGNSQEPRYPERSPTKDKNRRRTSKSATPAK